MPPVVTPMTNTSFLARTTWGQPRYLLVSMACMFVLALIPMGVRRAMRPTDFAPEQLLSVEHHESQDLVWMRDHFGGDSEVIVSWDGCTLSNAEPLALLGKKLESHRAAGTRLFASTTSGPQALRALMESHSGISYADAISRLEGSLIGPQENDAMGRSLGNTGRATCLIVKLAPATLSDIHTRKAALDAIPTIAAEQCGIDPATMHMIGAPVESVAMGLETPRAALPLFAGIGLWSAAIGYWRLRSIRLTAIVVGVAGSSAALAMALPSYAEIVQVLWNGHTSLGSSALSPQLLALSVVVYVLTLAAASYFVNAYGQARRVAMRGSESAAAEVAASIVWRQIAVATLATGAVLVMLAASDVTTLRLYGPYAALGLMASVALLFGIAPVVLHRYPLGSSRLTALESTGRLSGLPRFALDHSWPMLGAALFSLIIVGVGMTKLGAELKPVDLSSGSSTIACDSAWFERHLGNLDPLDIVLTMPAERLRGSAEHAEHDGQQYRLTRGEQLELVSEISRRLKACPSLSSALSAATFASSADATGLEAADLDRVDGKSRIFRDRLLAGDYVRLEHNAGGERLTGRELWRLNVRAVRRSKNGEAIDFGRVLADARLAIDPVLWSYQQRDRVVQTLHEHGKQLSGARVCVLFRAPEDAAAPPAAAQEFVLGELLANSGTAANRVSYFNLASYDRPGRGDASGDDAYRRSVLASLREQDVVVLASAASDPTARKIADTGILLADVTGLPTTAESSGALLADGGGPRPIRAAYAGPAAVVERAEQLLIGNLSHIFWIALGFVGAVLTLASMSVPAGLLTLSVAMAPLIAVLGVAGWLGLSLDLGVAMSLGLTVGLSVASVLDVIHWYHCGMLDSHDRASAAEGAVQLSRPAIINMAILAGLGAAPLALSSLVALREVAIVAAISAIASAVVCMSVLPAMLASPLGWFLASAEVRRLDPLWPRVQALVAKWRQTAVIEDEAELIPLPQAPRAPHFADAPAAAPAKAPAPGLRPVLSLGAHERREIAEGPHAALQAKLQGLRRPRTGDSPVS
jgi:hypothetical protein